MSSRISVFVNSNRWRLMLATLIIVGLALRVWGTRYGLPYLYHFDETVSEWIVLNIVRTGDLNPHFFGYGSLFFYLNALAYLPYFLLGLIAGRFHALADIPALQIPMLSVGRTLMPSQMILGRLVSVVAGTLCIPIAYWIGTQLRGRHVGLLAAIFVALSPSVILHSQFITPNILATLLVLLTLAALMRLTPQSGWWPYALVGIAFGCAMASKYNSGMVIVSCGVTYWMLHGRKAFLKPTVHLSLDVAALVFLAVTPFAILDFAFFVHDARYHLSYYASASHPGMEGDTIKYYLNYLLTHEGPLVFLGLLPFISYLRNRNRNGLILASFAIPYVVYVSALRVRNDRTILFAVPVLLIMAADLLYTIWRRASGSKSLHLKRFGQLGLALFASISIFYLAQQSVAQNIAQTTPDAREYARQWIETNVSTETRIAAEAYSPFMDPEQYKVSYFPYLIDNSPAWYVEQGFDLLVLSSGAFGPYYNAPSRYPVEAAAYQAFFDQFPEIARFDQNGWLVRILKTKP